MRIATYNINNVVARLPQLLAWLDVTAPDVVCLQEIKCIDAAFPVEALRAQGYESLVNGQKSWNGVAILSKGVLPLEIRRELPGDPADRQRRYLEAAVNGIVVGCLYAPNGNPQPGPKFDHKLAWMQRFDRHAASLLRSGHPVVLAGDYNVVPTDADIYSTASFKDNALLQPAPRAAFRKLLKQGWTDALKTAHPDSTPYTFWSYLRNRWPRDAGLRIDHLLLSPVLASKQRAAGVDRAVRGLEGASDHAPVWVDLDD
ncbi:MAG: exodeoxyribonuclease III [Gammaproteobacteria bacterium]|nr:exodeoxyribonuclease III [Gammaproteobacteria bacterium]